MPVAYQCRACKGPPLPREWEGPCPNCHGYYRAVKLFVRDDEVEGAEIAAIEDGEAISAGDLFKAVGDISKIETGLPGLDYVFDGGLPRLGGAILICAPAGVGKSTLLMTLLRSLAGDKGIDVMYISTEQTLKDLGQQFSWLGAFPSKRMLLHHVTDKDDVVKAIEKNKCKVYVVDSLHTVQNVTDSEGFSLATGHANAVAQVGTDLKMLAGSQEAVIFAVGHVNVDGTIAGGTRVRHMLDATLVLRGGKDERDERRVLEFEGKNRFGPRGRRALFKMSEGGFKDCGPLPEEEHG